MKRILLAFILLMAVSFTALAQDNYETPLYTWLQNKAKDSKEFSTLEIYRTDNPAEKGDFFITYNLNSRGEYMSAIMFNQASIRYEYNDAGKLVKDVFSIPGSVVYTSTYTYNANGQLIKEVTDLKEPDKEPVITSIKTYTYNDGGHVKAISIKKEETAEPTTEITFSYNISGLLEKAETIKKAGKDVYKTLEFYTYDAEGRLLKCEERNREGGMMNGELLWADAVDEVVTKSYAYADDTVTEKIEGRGSIYYMIYVLGK